MEAEAWELLVFGKAGVGTCAFTIRNVQNWWFGNYYYYYRATIIIWNLRILTEYLC